jgi:dienelactone hydrolase
MVLVHGGGGTAFADWVRLWTSRGYAAIAMDTCGCLPVGAHGDRPRHEHGGPPGWGGWGQIDHPREDQWTYHAVADVLLAHSLLRSLPQVDPERTGVTGISWGGYLTSLIAGVDSRFKLAAPVYGCGHYLDSHFAQPLSTLTEKQRDRWMRWWDPSAYLSNAEMPTLWVNGTNDFAYWLPAWQKSHRAVTGPVTLALRIRMPHGHAPGQSPEEIRIFADSILKDGVPLTQITDSGRDGDEVWATFQTQVAIDKAELTYTKDAGEWPERLWESIPATIEPDGRVSATLPEGVTVYYLNLFDARAAVVSTEHEMLQE